MVDIAIPPPDHFPIASANVECVLLAAERYRVPANVLLALATNEGGKNGQVVMNTNGTADISHFQINTSTYQKELAPLGVKLFDMQWRGCYNAHIAAYLLRKRLSDKNPDFWWKAATYHSRTPQYNEAYRNRLINNSVRWADWLSKNYSVTITEK